MDFHYFFDGLKHAVLGFVAVALFLRSQKKRPVPGIWFFLAAIWGSCALFVLPQIGEFPSRSLGFLYLLLHYPVPDWDILLFGYSWHRFFLFHSLILPWGLLTLSNRWPQIRDLALGLAVGMASHLIWDGATGSALTQVVFIPKLVVLTGILAWLWLILNGTALFLLAMYAPKKRP